MEIWKDVKNYEGLYQVSSIGRIRNRQGKILKLDITRNGYVHAQLWNRGKCKIALVHRIVALSFLEPIDGKTVVNHINCNPSDNRVENLEWCTQSENIKYCYTTGIANNVARKKIACREHKKIFYSSMEAATWVNATMFQNSKNVKTISRTIRSTANHEDGRTQSYGLHWDFV